VWGTLTASTPPISVIQAQKIKLNTQLPPGPWRRAAASSTFAVEKGAVVDLFAGPFGHWGRPALPRALMPEPTMSQDLRRHIWLPRVLDTGDDLMEAAPRGFLFRRSSDYT
jgi:hypothetical protein